MPTILNCRRTAVFHPHDVPGIYTDAMRPGHVLEAEGLAFEVVDLRPIKMRKPKAKRPLASSWRDDM